jgi:hypothetical protein
MNRQGISDNFLGRHTLATSCNGCDIIAPMSTSKWPDALQPPQPAQLQLLLTSFWVDLATLADLLTREQFLLAAEQVHFLRQTILQMMLALNGIQRPTTRDLNLYLSASQRAALEKTLLQPNTDNGSMSEVWIAQAVALVVIYRWYAPQLVAKYGLTYPHEEEKAAWYTLVTSLPTWPQQVTTE